MSTETPTLETLIAVINELVDKTFARHGEKPPLVTIEIQRKGIPPHYFFHYFHALIRTNNKLLAASGDDRDCWTPRTALEIAWRQLQRLVKKEGFTLLDLL